MFLFCNVTDPKILDWKLSRLNQIVLNKAQKYNITMDKRSTSDFEEPRRSREARRLYASSDWSNLESRLTFRVVKKIAKAIHSSSKSSTSKPKCFSVSKLLVTEIISHSNDFPEYKILVKKVILGIGTKSDILQASLGPKEKTDDSLLKRLINFSL